MNARATSMMLIALMVAGPARAQDGGVETDASLEEEQTPEKADPTTGALPMEDPTIQPTRDEDLRVDDELSSEADAEPGSDGEEAAETDTKKEEPTAGALPIEDPTRAPEKEKELEESLDEPGAAEDDEDNVKVVYDQGFLVAVDNWFFISLSGLLQARYTVNYRTDPPTDPDTGIRDKMVTQGFDVARARFTLGIGLTEFVALVMRIGVVAGGDFDFQRAFIDLKWKYFRLRAGLFMQELVGESFINPHNLYFLDYTIMDNVFSPGGSAGVMFTYLRQRFSINLGYSNGLRTGFTEIRDPAKADFAVTVRAQYAWGERGLAGFNQLNVRRGTPFGVRLGVAAHYQDGGRSGGSQPVKIALLTADLGVRGNGWSTMFGFTLGQDSVTDAPGSLEAGEVVTGALSAMGGYFVLESLELYGQYSFVSRPKIQGVLPPTVDEVLTQPSDFHAFGVGFSYWFIPGRDHVKLQSDFIYYLGHETGSTVPSSPLNSIQPNADGSQFSWRIQISAHF
jgi:hypothetical protein